MSATHHHAVDTIQQRLTDYAFEFDKRDIPAAAAHAAKARVIDTLGALIGAFSGEPCQIARNLAAQARNLNGSTVIGTRIKTTPDLAAFANATTARYLEFNDLYHWPGSVHGHPSDVVMPLLAAAEHARVTGSQFTNSIVLSYEIFCRLCDVFHNGAAFDNTNFATLGIAVAAGKLLWLNRSQLSNCISIAAVTSITLRQAREGRKSMFKAAAAGQAGRAGVFAALMARAGMEGPHLPFEGEAGWCAHVAREQISLAKLAATGGVFKILDTRIKPRPSEGGTIGCILAAEKIAPLPNIADVKKVTIEIYKSAKERFAAHVDQFQNPQSRESADHSITYNVSAVLMDGTVTPRSFDDAHLNNRELRALMQKTEVVENEEFSKAFERIPVEHRVRITVTTMNGAQLVGIAGGAQDDLSVPASDMDIERKFENLTSDVFSAKRRRFLLDYLWHLERVGNVAELPPALVLD